MRGAAKLLPLVARLQHTPQQRALLSSASQLASAGWPDADSVHTQCRSTPAPCQHLGQLQSALLARATLPLLFRTFATQAVALASSNSDVPGGEHLDRTNSLLQQVQVLKLRQELEDEAEEHMHIPYTKLLDMVKLCGAAHDDREAADLALALHKAGVVILHHNIVYLRPTEVADLILQALPGSKEDLVQRLAKVEAELRELDQKHDMLDRDAHRISNRFLVAGYVVLFVQLVAFIWLTWWELSWDVMEPIAYMISLFYSLVGYTYFLATRGRGIFDLQPFKEFWYMHMKTKKAAALQFDEERWRHLSKLRERYKKQLSGSGRATIKAL